MACSLICATKKLSTMLYSEFTSMEKTIGSAMDASSGPTGFSFINVLFMKNPPLYQNRKNIRCGKQSVFFVHNKSHTICLLESDRLCGEKSSKLKNPHVVLVFLH